MRISVETYGADNKHAVYLHYKNGMGKVYDLMQSVPVDIDTEVDKAVVTAYDKDLYIIKGETYKHNDDLLTVLGKIKEALENGEELDIDLSGKEEEEEVAARG